MEGWSARKWTVVWEPARDAGAQGGRGIIIPGPKRTRRGNWMESPGRGGQMMEWCL